MIGVGVGERVGAELAAADLTHYPFLGLARAGIDQSFADEIDVDRIGREPVEHEDALGALLHQCTPRIRLGIAICSKEARSSICSRCPFAAAESGKTR